MEHLCEVQSNSQGRLQTHGGLSCGKGFRWTETLLPRGSRRFAIGLPISSGICLHIPRWRIIHCAAWKGSQWERLLEGEQYVFILYTSV